MNIGESPILFIIYTKGTGISDRMKKKSSTTPTAHVYANGVIASATKSIIKDRKTISENDKTPN